MTSKSGKPTDPSNGQLFVYGLDDAGKPKGARFPAAEAERVLPVATAMNLRCSQAGSDETASPGMKLPVGRIYARGKAFIPNIKRDLYEKLVAALDPAGGESDHSQADGTPLLRLLRRAKLHSHRPIPEPSCRPWRRDCRRTGNQ